VMKIKSIVDIAHTWITIYGFAKISVVDFVVNI